MAPASITTVEEHIGQTALALKLRNCFVCGFGVNTLELGQYFGQVFYPPQNIAIDYLVNHEGRSIIDAYHAAAGPLEKLFPLEVVHNIFRAVKRIDGSMLGLIGLGLYFQMKERTKAPLAFHAEEFKVFFRKLKFPSPINFVKQIPRELDVYVEYTHDIVGGLLNGTIYSFPQTANSALKRFHISPFVVGRWGVKIGDDWINES